MCASCFLFERLKTADREAQKDEKKVKTTTPKINR